jgi:hypothetical protein
MPKPAFYLAAIISFLFCLPALALADETLTITTYYPSPYGVYRELRSQRMAIGDSYIQSGTYDWEASDGDGGEIDYQADLVVQGNVGIGTANPGSRFQVGTDTVLQQWSGSTPYVLIQGVDNEVATPAFQIKDENQTEMFSVNTTGDSGATARIYMQGKVGIGTTNPQAPLSVYYGTAGAPATSGSSDPNIAMRIHVGSIGLDFGTYTSGTSWIQNRLYNNYASNYNLILQPNGGNVGIGTASPGDNLTVVGHGLFNSGTNSLRITDGWTGWPDTANNKGEIAIDTGSYKTMMIIGPSIAGLGRRVSVWDRFEVNGTAYSSSGTWSGSDIRWKKNVENLPNDTLDRVLKLRGVKFEWRRENFKDKSFRKGKQIGVIAQEVEKQFPELISTDADGYKSFAYDKFTAVLLEAIKAQQQQIEFLKAKIDKKP